MNTVARHMLAFRLSFVALLVLAPIDSYGKCQTSRIVAVGDAYPQGVEISGPDTAGRFNVWNGPQVRVNGKAVHLDPDFQHGHFIDWASGPIDERPSGDVLFMVSFFCHIDAGDSRDHQMYVVDYLFSPNVDGGYIFLPGRDDARHRSNVSTIVHGVEGNWFRSTKAWEDTIRPILQRAIDE